MIVLLIVVLCIAGISADPKRASSSTISPLDQFEEFYKLGIELKSAVYQEIDGEAVKFVSEDRFEQLDKLKTTLEKEAVLEEMTNHLGMDESEKHVFLLTVYITYLHWALKRYFGGDGKSSYVDNTFAMVKRKLYKSFGLQSLLDQLKRRQHRPQQKISFANKEKLSIGIVAKDMAKGKVHLSEAYKLTKGPPTNVQDLKEVKNHEMVKMIGQTFHFYFAKYWLKSADILNQVEFYGLLIHLSQQEENVVAQLEKTPGDKKLLKFRDLIYLIERLLTQMNEHENGFAYNIDLTFRENFNEIWTNIRDILYHLEILKQGQEIDWGFALEMAIGKYPKTEKQKLAFDTLLGGNGNRSTVLFQTVGIELMHCFHYKQGEYMKKNKRLYEEEQAWLRI